MRPKRLAELRDPILAAYMGEILEIPLLTVGEERDLLAKARNGDRDATNAIVSANLRFVVAVSWNFRNRGLPLPDLINEGNLALFRALECFEPRQEIRFMSYAVWWIRQGILSALARQAGSISFPPDRLHKAILLRRIENRLAQRLGRSPDRDEVVSEMGGGSRAASGISAALEGLASTRGIGGPGPDLESLALSDGDGPEESIGRELIRKALKERMQRLSARERRILSLRYGLANGDRLSLSEVGSLMGITRERVRQLEERALATLKRTTRALRQ